MKRFLSLLTALICLIFTCSCGNSDFTAVRKYSKPDNMKSVSSGAVADNGKFRLIWDSEVGNLILYNNKTESIWASTPYEFYKNPTDVTDFANTCLSSSLMIVCLDTSNTEKEFYSYDSVFLNGSAYSVRIDNGIRVIYFFDDAGVSVPVDYTLTEKGLNAEILVDQITESGDYRLYKIGLLPYFASAENSSENYAFVPSGSGAIMYTDDESREARYYSEMVYGTEPSQNFLSEPAKEHPIRLPVFGMKAGNRGIIGVIENAKESAYVNADIGNSLFGYSGVYASFQVRGTDQAVLKNVSNLNVTAKNSTQYITSVKTASVSYIPLDDGGSYNRMASAYREYLQAKGYLADTEAENTELYLEILGAAKVKKNFLGISYDKVAALTTIEQAQEIVDRVAEQTGTKPVVTLKGFGKGGIDFSSPAGGYTIDSCIGSRKQLKSLFESFAAASIPTFMDFDLINYTESGDGFSVSRDCAYTANNVPVKDKSYKLVTHFTDSSKITPTLLSRSELPAAGEKLLKAVDKLGVGGVSLATLSNTAYGDYKYQKYYAKSGMAEDATAIINALRKNGVEISVNAANDYAAICAGYISSTPSTSSRYLTLDKDIPFYRMVFKGYISQASEPINLALNPRLELLDAVSCGTALNFTVCSRFDSSLIYGTNSGISGSVFEDIEDSIYDSFKSAHELLSKLSGTTLESYEENGGLVKTVFGNGITVYANRTDSAVKTPVGELEPYGFGFSEKGN